MRAWIKGALAFTAGAYIYDVVLRPGFMAQRAREAANRLGKPVINIGAGTPSSSLRTWLFGPTTWGDVNVDVAGPAGVVGYGDIMHLPYPDKTFGAAFVSHVLEHVEDPVGAVLEMARVADTVWAVTPRWWAPHTWLYTDHRWYICDNGDLVSLWRSGPVLNKRLP